MRHEPSRSRSTVSLVGVNRDLFRSRHPDGTSYVLTPEALWAYLYDPEFRADCERLFQECRPFTLAETEAQGVAR